MMTSRPPDPQRGTRWMLQLLTVLGVQACTADPCVPYPCSAGETCHTVSADSHLCFSPTCRHTQHGEDYKGTLSTTYTGRTCQRWDSQSPHAHGNSVDNFVGETSLTDINNYCRDNGYGPPRIGVTCMTTDPNAPYEHCVIPICNDPCVSNPCHRAETCHATSDTTYNCLSDRCYHEEGGLDYVGTMAVDRNGVPCVRWDIYSDMNYAAVLYYYAAETLTQANNYCRGYPGIGLRCYTAATGGSWDFCTSPPHCDGYVYFDIEIKNDPYGRILATELHDESYTTCLILKHPFMMNRVVMKLDLHEEGTNTFYIKIRHGNVPINYKHWLAVYMTTDGLMSQYTEPTVGTTVLKVCVYDAARSDALTTTYLQCVCLKECSIIFHFKLDVVKTINVCEIEVSFSPFP